MKRNSLFLLLSLKLGATVGHPDAELFGPLHDHLALLGGHGVRDLGAVAPVVHEKHLELLDIVHEDLLEAVGEHVAGLPVGAVADGGVGDGALELAADAGINTAGLAPSLALKPAHPGDLVTLVAVELLRALLDNRLGDEGGDLSHDKVRLEWGVSINVYCMCEARRTDRGLVDGLVDAMDDEAR